MTILFTASPPWRCSGLFTYNFSNAKMKKYKSLRDILGFWGLLKFNLKNLFASRQLKAHRKLMIITKALNEDWQPDYKYYPYFTNPSKELIQHIENNPPLYFKSREAAEYAGQQFKDDYRDLWGI